MRDISNNEHRIVGFELNDMRFNYNDFMIWYILLVLDSLGFIVDDIRTLDNWRPDMPFDYAGQGQAGNDYLEEDYDYAGASNFGNDHDFSSWRLGGSLRCCYVLYICNWHALPLD